MYYKTNRTIFGSIFQNICECPRGIQYKDHSTTNLHSNFTWVSSDKLKVLEITHSYSSQEPSDRGDGHFHLEPNVQVHVVWCGVRRVPRTRLVQHAVQTSLPQPPATDDVIRFVLRQRVQCSLFVLIPG